MSWDLLAFEKPRRRSSATSASSRAMSSLYSEMQTGRKLQMQTMDNALLELYQKGEITYDMALSHSREPNALRHQTGDVEK